MKVLLFISALIFVSCSAEKKMFKKAEEVNTINAYEKYLLKYKNGNYAETAVQKIEDLRFYQSRDSSFSKFLKCLKTEADSSESGIVISPSHEILMGTPVSIEMQNLPLETEVTLHAYRRRWNGLYYSYAAFRTDTSGRISLSENKPNRGSYSGADGLGVFWSMTKIPLKSHESHVDVKDLKWNTIYFFLEDNKTIAAKDSLKLVQHFSPLVSEKINNDTLSGVFYYPADSSNLPLFILVSSGSGGASYQARQSAKIIADHGFASLVLFYSGTKLLPQHLEKIPLEYFFNAFDWIKKKPMIESSKIVLCGGSKGGELVLLLASMRPDIKAVIAVEPSCVLWQGMPYNPWTVFFPRPAWLYKGKALPYLDHKLDLSIMMKFGTGARQIELCRLYSEVLDDKKNVEKALIEVENINGPVLLIAGKDQQVWPAYRMCRMIEQRLDSLDFNYPVKGLYYENAGHNVTAPDLPPTIDYKYEQIKTGGTHAGNAAAQQHSWNEVIKFLKTCFKK